MIYGRNNRRWGPQGTSCCFAFIDCGESEPRKFSCGPKSLYGNPFSNTSRHCLGSSTWSWALSPHNIPEVLVLRGLYTPVVSEQRLQELTIPTKSWHWAQGSSWRWAESKPSPSGQPQGGPSPATPREHMWFSLKETPLLQDTTVCVLQANRTRVSAEREAGASEEKVAMCYNFVWVVPIPKYHDNIFWSKDQRTYGLTHGLTKGKNIWNWEYLRQFEMCGYNHSQSTWKSWSSLGNTLKNWQSKSCSPNLEWFYQKNWDSLVHRLYDCIAGTLCKKTTEELTSSYMSRWFTKGLQKRRELFT